MSSADEAGDGVRLWTALETRYRLSRDRVLTESGPIELYRVADLERLIDSVDLVDGTERLPYWAELWPSAVGLARAIARGTWPLHRMASIELGCGLGLVGLAAAAAGAQVVATDYELDAVRCARLSAIENGLLRVCHVAMDWRRPAFRSAFSLVLAADVLYDATDFVPVADAMATLLAPRGCALIAEPGREVAKPFFDMVRGRGWSVACDGSESVDQGAPRPTPVTIYRLVPDR